MSILNKISFKNFYLQFVFKGFIADILLAYKGLRVSFDRQLYNNTNESRLLAYSFFISIILFLQRLPSRVSQNPQYFDEINLDDKIGIDLFSSIFTWAIYLHNVTLLRTTGLWKFSVKYFFIVMQLRSWLFDKTLLLLMIIIRYIFIISL